MHAQGTYEEQIVTRTKNICAPAFITHKRCAIFRKILRLYPSCSFPGHYKSKLCLRKGWLCMFYSDKRLLVSEYTGACPRRTTVGLNTKRETSSTVPAIYTYSFKINTKDWLLRPKSTSGLSTCHSLVRFWLATHKPAAWDGPARGLLTATFSCDSPVYDY